MQALITGGSGFLGKALSKYLIENNYDVSIFDSGNTTQNHIQGSIVNYDEIKSAVKDMDVVFHLAGLLGTTELMKQNILAIDLNIKGTVNVLEACHSEGVSRVFLPTKPDRWLNTYTITKKASEQFAQLYAKYKGLDVRILRWLNAYGPGQKAFPIRKAVPIMVIQAIENKDIEIWGDGTQTVYMNYSEDLARNTVLYTIKENIDSTVRDTGNIIEMSVNNLAQLILKLSKSDSKITHLPMRLGEDPTKHLEPLPGQTAAAILGVDTQTTPIEIGMSATISYYQKLSPQIRIDALKFYSKNI